MAQSLDAERAALDGLLAGWRRGSPDLVASLDEFLVAGTPRDALRSVQRHPELLADQGEALMRALVAFCRSAGLVGLGPAIEDRASWLLRLRQGGFGRFRSP
jgi:hypothetical protein